MAGALPLVNVESIGQRCDCGQRMASAERRLTRDAKAHARAIFMEPL